MNRDFSEVASYGGYFVMRKIRLFRRNLPMEYPKYHPFRSEKAREQYRFAYTEWEKVWPGVSETRIIQTDYGQTLVRVGGPENAPPLVLLPGAGATSLMWSFNIEALSRDFRTYAVDYDYGRSFFTRPVDNVAGLIDWFHQLFNGLGLGDNIHLMGASLGGWQVAQYAREVPDRVGKLVLLAPAATILPLRQEFSYRLMCSMIPVRPFSNNLMNWLFRDLIQSGETGRRMAVETLGQMMLAIKSFNFQPRRYQKLTVWEDGEWQSLKMPTLFLVGENEKIYPPRQAIDRLHRIAPGIRTELIPGAGHDVSVVKADLVNEKILRFLKE
jgi:pimeloyl-ACP methyl ester carboxylesterase